MAQQKPHVNLVTIGHVVSDYVLPEFADKDTLFIGISYSGNTEETIAALEEAEKRGCQVRLITSGGKLAASGHTLVRIPQNIQPRSAIGYMLKPLLSSFLKLPEETYLGISKLLEDIDGDNTEEKNLAMEIFKHRSIPVILGYHPFRWVAYSNLGIHCSDPSILNFEGNGSP